jgi:DNA-binding NtrC family response regulator
VTFWKTGPKSSCGSRVRNSKLIGGKQVKSTLVLITEKTDDVWARELSSIVRPLGMLELLSCEEFQANKLTCEYQLVIVDSGIKCMNVNTLISALIQLNPQCRVVAMTAAPTWKRARAAFEAGALDYLSKNVPSDEVVACLRAALEKPLVRTKQGATL